MYDAPHVAPVTPETFESLRDCAERGAFFRVMLDERLAGFVAARPDTFRCWEGWLIVEEVLASELRGKGFGPAIQRALLAELDEQLGTSVFGTILSDNLPSLGTARRVGREIVEVGSFVHLEE